MKKVGLVGPPVVSASGSQSEGIEALEENPRMCQRLVLGAVTGVSHQEQQLASKGKGIEDEVPPEQTIVEIIEPARETIRTAL
jgi:hypothetical protein